MDERIKKRIRVILSNSVVSPVEDNYNFKSFTSEDISRIQELKKSKVIENPFEWVIQNDHADTLIKLYRQLPRKGQLDMIEFLSSYVLDGSSSFIKNVVIIVLVNTDNANALIGVIESGFTNYNQRSILYSILALADVLKFQPDQFTEESIERLHDWTEAYLDRQSDVGKEAREWGSLYKDFDTAIEIIRHKTVTILSRSFTQQVNANFNPEINEDELKMRNLFSEFGFPPDLNESLSHINEQISNGDTPFKFKNTMDSIRAFTERLFATVAKTIDEDTRIDGTDSEKAAKYFKEKGLVSEEMAGLIVQLRHFISNNGVHRLKSRREDARIAKNLVVEVGLYLITRLREL